ncbi:hypothetical protein KFK09_018450 [Dendrobium nobile]|uniref:V-ATPase proteolipid subunit C-like domain-containing protein n=1 Tax=Dendrobium nobile TaxID=94219 RepID=A0A8T3AVV2_DENNO|nr:hypothetical protein KFK09_018450 [Dendrobium nobile]
MATQIYHPVWLVVSRGSLPAWLLGSSVTRVSVRVGVLPMERLLNVSKHFVERSELTFNAPLLARANAQQPKLFFGMILILIFVEALALYGLIVGIILSSRAGQSRAD